MARQRQAGLWLRQSRISRGYESAGEFARVLEIDPSMVSRYERGMSEVSDERAEQIAEILRMDIIDVRRGLGLWVPSESGYVEEPETLTLDQKATLIQEYVATAQRLLREIEEEQNEEVKRQAS